MPSTFSFSSNSLVGAGYLNRAGFSTGAGPGVNDPEDFSAVAPDQAIDAPGDVDVVALTLVAGHSYVFDIDGGIGGSNPIDLQLDVINQAGTLVATSDVAGGDPLLVFTPTVTGVYYVAVRHHDNDYINGFFAFESDIDGAIGDTGDYSLVISTPTLPPLVRLGDGRDIRSYDNAAQRVMAEGGDDEIRLRGGDDIATGGNGRDLLLGGSGDDELIGNQGADTLGGNDGDDVLMGGNAADELNGGDGRDGLNGGNQDDLLRGGAGNDMLSGDAGRDRILGESGDDVIRGGKGIDTLFGGAGRDTFHFLRGEAPFDAEGVIEEDLIEDFETGDRIDLSDVLLGTLDLVEGDEFSRAGQLRVDLLANGLQEVLVNLDGNPETAELAILVDTMGGFRLDEGDFIL
jgi:Ca2+-binding RTX toxin-like protein